MSKSHRSPSRAPRLKSWRGATGRQEPTPKPDTPPPGWLRRLWKWLVAAVAAPLATLLGLYATGLLNEIFPTASDLACQVRELREQVRKLTYSPEPSPPFSPFRILLTTLEHDVDGRQTRHVQYALRGQTAFKVVPACRVLKIDYGITQSELEGRKRGRALLDAYQADVLIWGDVAKSDETLRLWFLSRERDTLTPETRSSYTLEKTTLPKDFGEDFAVQLMALVLSSVKPVTEQTGTYLVATMQPVAARLDALRAHPPDFFTPLQKAALHHSFALAAQTIGEQAGESRWLKQAVEAYRAALQEYTRECVPLDWAMTQNNLGTALMALGEQEKRDSSTARLEEAVATFRAALEEYTPERAPLRRAATQNNLGTALTALGKRKSWPVVSPVLLELTRWVLLDNERALDFATSREEQEKRESGMAQLEEAVAVFRAALQEYTRERMPLDWAMTQNNLGTALAILGEHWGSYNTPPLPARLKEAVAAYRAALQEYTRERVPLDWAMTQNNLGTVLLFTALSERDSGTARLEEAVATFRAALEEYTPERMPLRWVAIQNNLGAALMALGERDSGTARLEEAVATYQEAFKLLDTKEYEYYRNIVGNNLHQASSLLKSRSSGK